MLDILDTTLNGILVLVMGFRLTVLHHIKAEQVLNLGAKLDLVLSLMRPIGAPFLQIKCSKVNDMLTS